MIEALRIRGYRCFPDFRIRGLGQVNLLVGRNCSGKTALLEAVEAVTAHGPQLARVWAPLLRRGERLPEHGDRPSRFTEYDVSHLFFGHTIGIGAKFEIEGESRAAYPALRVTIVQRARDSYAGPTGLFPEDEFDAEGSPVEPVGLSIGLSGSPEPLLVPITSRGGLRPRALGPTYDRLAPDEDVRNTTYVSPDSLTAFTASQYWKSIALTTEEHLVVEALRVLQPDVARVAFVDPPRREGASGRGGLLVLFKGAERPVPIGSLGDGMWRMFCIAVALIRSRAGTLLIDEIDSGLHHSVMENMWWLVLQTAERHDTQVFATTHSSDCVSSLASICRGGRPGQVSLQRIESGASQAVAYSEEEIWAAARHGIETR